jgi:hypothetical protein
VCHAFSFVGCFSAGGLALSLFFLCFTGCIKGEEKQKLKKNEKTKNRL